MEYEYWIINYISCEGNPRWGIYKTQVGVTEDDLHTELYKGGGCGDDPSEWVSAELTCDLEDEYYIDWTHINTYN